MKIEILTRNGLLQLRNLLASEPSLVFENLEVLREAKNIEFAESNYSLSTSFELALPQKNALTVAEKKDQQNAIGLFENLEGLNPADANDERLWVTLALTKFHSYTLQRWGQGLSRTSSKSDLKKFIKNHLLIGSTRNRWRDQSISRLWWMSYYAKSTTPDRYELSLALLLSNSDFVSQVLGKPSIGTSRNLSAALLSVVSKRFVAGSKYSWNRVSFRMLMKKIDLLAGRRILNALPVAELEKEVDALFIECFS
jgi:hypothetical protein